MKFRVSPGKDISFVITEKELDHLERNAENIQFYKNAITCPIDEINRIGGILGCSKSKVLDKALQQDGIQVEGPGKRDQIYAVNIPLVACKVLRSIGSYHAPYDPKDFHKMLTIKVEGSR